MPIAALPPTTVRAIGSASVISDPCSIVKELLDNALDAAATSVFIEISQNTLDVIQVKDNGHGIPSSDHPFVCKRTFTSKIQTVEDLRTIGGRCLGFRGEALASAAEISGGLTVSTRVQHEPVGSSVRYGRDGELLSTQRASHPVGTSVRITDLFKHIPVRRQTTLKNATKTLVRIKKLVHAYAIAQPAKRLSLRVLKAKTEANNWMYAPGQTTLLDAALKVMGTDASSCLVREWPPNDDSDQSLQQKQAGFRIVALFPDPSDLSKGNGSGQYISIDGRPLSTTRGIAQDIAKLYKSYIRSAASRQEPSPNITDPLLCLHVICTDVSYDVNIEPAKDDILLENAQELLSLVEELLCDVYGEKPNSAEEPKAISKEKGPVSHKNSCDLLLAQKPEKSSRPKSPGGSATNFTSTRFTQATDSETHSPGAETRTELRDGSNPWSIMRSNMPTPKADRAPRDTWASTRTTVQSPGSRRNSQETLQTCSPRSFLPSPSASTKTTPESVESSPSGQTQSPTDATQRKPKQASRERDRERYGNGALDTWFTKTTLVNLSPATASNEPGDQERPLHQLAQERFGSPERPADNPNELASHGVATDSQDSSESEPEDSGSLLLRNPELRERHAGLPVLERWSSRLHQLSKTGHLELQNALDFENRKREAIARRREQLKSRSEQSSNSPHLSRYLAAKAALQPDVARDEQNSPILSPLDPRSYLMRLAQRGTAKKSINSNKLPFETIPDGCELYCVSLKQKADLPLLSTMFGHISTTDLYTQRGDQVEAFPPHDDSPIDLWRHRLTNLTKDKYPTGSGLPELQFDFSHLVQRSEGHSE
ncbi:hypothetical protein BO94DRAFT_625901 [Aspergillus sclerotioniger CBS 115572]|uniref:DNA mismatch repair protein S5 domain-containing protein n=1 Tax=Aspergillus sclerotioniger CBS 115572 TaxID=1450535 RepID=A0A317W2F2_9EURO|nr:hypothetical protein BO94DRAFT_625901 [Aspergillus sclerotioniger CBS 115572]PWY80754.1 hypothetical protein BO94DRAFT_625901 [Aspergillus sclerotioniger CBS 115572]